MAATDWDRRVKSAKRRRRIREQAITALGRYCSICGYDGLSCPPAMDFHHPDALEKDFSISSKITSFAAIEAELRKCVLLCSRCHREVHDGLHANYIIDVDDGRGQLPLGDEDPYEDDLECEF